MVSATLQNLSLLKSQQVLEQLLFAHLSTLSLTRLPHVPLQLFLVRILQQYDARRKSTKYLQLNSNYITHTRVTRSRGHVLLVCMCISSRVLFSLDQFGTLNS